MRQHHRFTSYCLAVLAGVIFSSDPEIGKADDRPTHLASKKSKWQATQPKWSELAALLGKRTDAKSVQSFVKRHRLKSHQKFTSGGFSGYGEFPVSLLFRDFRITRVIVIINRAPDSSWPRAPIYRKPFPYSVKPTDKPEDVIRRIGRPSHHPYRGHVRYEKLGLTFSFDRRTHQLVEIDIDAPKKPRATSQSK